MSWSRPFRLCAAPSAAGLLFLSALAQPVFADESTSVMTLDDAGNAAKNLARMNCGATLDVIGPDGRIVTVTNKNKDSGAGTLLFDDDTLSYPLPEGDTILLLSFPRTSELDRFTF